MPLSANRIGDKMKKVVLLFVIVFLLTGCTATYHLEIDDNIFKESISLNDMDVSEDLFNVYLTNPMPFHYQEKSYLDYDYAVGPSEVKKTEGHLYYNLSKNNNNGIDASSKVNIRNYSDSRALHSVFNSSHINNYDDYISIYGYGGIYAFSAYPNLSKITVNITVDKMVRESNADEVNGNTYTWILTPENLDKTVYIEIESTKISKGQDNQNKIELDSKVMIALGAIVALVVVAFISLRSIIKKQGTD